MTMYEEWQVTGRWGDDPYEYTWRGADSERQARHFVTTMRENNIPWTDGPHLHRRTVTVSEWTEVDA